MDSVGTKTTRNRIMTFGRGMWEGMVQKELERDSR